METKLIDGKAIAKDIRISVRKRVDAHMAEGMEAPRLAVVLVGENPASKTYVRSKIKACAKVHIESESVILPESVDEETLLGEIIRLNNDPSINGILVQLPLPKHIDMNRVIQTISPAKDVDGFHIESVGALASGLASGFVPCTPAGIIELIKRSGVTIDGASCVVIGRSNIVGKPVAMLLLEENGTVTICHSHTKNLPRICQEADILVVAIGRAGFVDGSMLKEGACVIDVGINRVDDQLVGDVDTESCMGIAGCITPVPGGVGPMTIAMLMQNCLLAYEAQHKIEG